MSHNGQITLYPYQKESILEIEDFQGRALLAHEMGLGKTIISLLYLKRDPKKLFPALVVCPASVKYNWQHECITHANISPRVLEGQKPPSNVTQLLDRELVTIINYDILKHWLPYLEECHFQTIVFDECHYLQNRSAQRTKAAIKLARGIPHCLALSGTPLTNRPAELFTTLNILRPDEFRSFYRYAQTFCAPKLTRWGWDFGGASNLNRLHKLLRRTCMVRYLKKDVLKELPDKIRRVVPLEMSHPDEYIRARDDFIGWLQKNHPKRIAKASKAISLARTGDLLRLAARLKLRGVVDWANRFLAETDEKLVIFAVHKKCIQVLQRRIKTRSVTIDGSVTGKERHLAVQQFQNDPKTRLCIGNIRAAGVGIGLTASSTSAFAELWWKPGDHTQAEDRIHRIGQRHQSWIYYFVAGGTIEETLCKIIQKKQQVIRAALDGQTGFNDLNVYDQLLQELKKNGSNN